MGIQYTRVSEFGLVDFVDSDWGACIDDRRSTSGWIFNLGSGSIAWASKKQDSTALSSTEVEYMAASAASCQAIWLRRLLFELGVAQQGPTILYCDNRSTISITKNPAMHGRTKHIDLRYHHIRELVADGQIQLNFCGTDEQVADVLTKSLPVYKFERFREKIGVLNKGVC